MQALLPKNDVFVWFWSKGLYQPGVILDCIRKYVTFNLVMITLSKTEWRYSNISNREFSLQLCLRILKYANKDNLVTHLLTTFFLAKYFIFLHSHTLDMACRTYVNVNPNLSRFGREKRTIQSQIKLWIPLKNCVEFMVVCLFFSVWAFFFFFLLFFFNSPVF